MYAAGKIPGSFFKREGRPSEKGILTARMIDRPIRPLFPKGWTLRDADRRDADVHRPRQPLRHPRDERRLGGAGRVRHPVPDPGRRGADRQARGQVRRQPRRGRTSRVGARPDRRRHRRRDPDGRGRRQRGHRGRDPRRARHRARGDQEALRRPARAGRSRPASRRWRSSRRRSTRSSTSRSRPRTAPSSTRATQVEDKLERQDATKAVEEAVLAQYALPTRATEPVDPERRAAVQLAFDKLEKDIIRRRIAVDKRRPDGRAADEIREVTAEVGIAPRTHGSALFTRGQTQAFTRRDARHEPRGAAPRHARARDLQALLPPLQLPAVLGRGGGLHARAEAPRHRSRRARRAGAPADDPVAWRSSRTRSASCPTSSSRTAPRRWPRSAARRSR